MFQNASLASEADKLLYGLSCSRRPWLLNRWVVPAPAGPHAASWPHAVLLRCRLLHYCLDPDKIRKQDAISTIALIGNNAVGQPLAWNFVWDKWDHLVR